MTDRRWIAAVAAGLAGAALLLVPRAATAAGAPAAVVVAPSTATPTKTERALQLERRLHESRAAHEQALSRLAELRRNLAVRAAQADYASQTAALAAASLEADEGLAGVLGSLVGGDDALDRADAAMDHAQHLYRIRDIAARGVADARREVTRTANAYDRAQAAATRLERSAGARAAARLALEWSVLQDGYEASTTERDERNRAALVIWRKTLHALGAAGIAPPAAAVLERPTLPENLRPLRDSAGQRVLGTALARGRDGQPLQVIPATAVDAVSAAFASLGAGAPDTSCAGFVQRIWALARVDIAGDSATLWAELAAVSKRQIATGDLVFFQDSVEHRVGIAVSSRLAIALDPVAGEVAVHRILATDLLGVRRVTLAPENGERPGAVPPMLQRPCLPPPPEPTTVVGDVTGPLPLPAVGADGLILPVPDGAYSMSADFGTAGSLWSSGSHTGQDFSAPMGTPVVAAGAGTVTVEDVGWAGRLVRVDHGDGVETWYAHMSSVDVATGDTVAAGAPLGGVGSEGNSTGPHLHFEVRVNGVAVDPMEFLGR